MSTSISTQSLRSVSSSQQVPIRSYKTLAEAERAVDRLSECRFPLEYVSLAARGVKGCGHPSAARTFPAGVVTSGRLTGAILIILALLAGGLAAEGRVLAVIFGAAAGAVLGLGASVMLAARRPTCDCPAIVADRYDVVVDAQWAADAQHVLKVADCG